PVCHAYDIDGVSINQIPFNFNDAPIKPMFKKFTGWSEDLTAIKTFDALPDSFKAYMKYVEQEVGQKMSVISVGPDREQTIMVD
ncbi:MAG: adenylosuccinate synthetase, partial [Bacteroidota bacterium]